MSKVTVIGAGSWGCGLAKVLADNNHQVLLFDKSKEIIDEINSFHTNKSKLKEGDIPLSVVATTDIKKAISFSNIIVLVVPTAVTRIVLNEVNKVIDSPKIFVNASKGLELETSKRISEVLYDVIDKKYIEGYVTLTGPSHAEEVILEKLTLVTAASLDIKIAKKIQVLFSNSKYFRVYTSNDLIGVEFGGAFKNVYALASGIGAGLGFGVNAEAALITRGLTEMKRLALHLGAKEETLSGLTGVGDLIVTCTSNLSRNFQAGYMIGKGKDLKEALSKITMVVEGARASAAAYNLAKKHNIYTPIIDAVYNVIYNYHNPFEEISRLMAKELKQEVE